MQLTSFRTVALALALLPTGILAGGILKTDGFETCLENSDITITTVEVTYDSDNETVTFNLAGSSATEQNVTASLVITAYGEEVYSKTFDPCDSATEVEQLCPGMYTRSAKIIDELRLIDRHQYLRVLSKLRERNRYLIRSHL
jgi:hypothetical protein